MNAEFKPNTNCLEGFQCPICGHTEDFRICAEVLVLVTDDGVAEDLSGSTWDDDAHCECAGCDHAGRVRDFSGEADKSPAGVVQETPTAPLTAVLIEALEAQAMADADPEASHRKGYYEMALELRIKALNLAGRTAY